MVKCSKTCTPMCDFCAYAIHEVLEDEAANPRYLLSAPIDCLKHPHDPKVDDCYYCDDYRCLLAPIDNHPPIVTLCGSSRFEPLFHYLNNRFTRNGWIVLSMGVFGHSDSEIYALTPTEKERLDELHKRKIDMSDAIYVVNPEGYIGESTRSEINYALTHGKEVYYYYEENRYD